jgi:hypothetical protein
MNVRVYLAGYRNGQRLAGRPGVVPRKRYDDPYLVSLGANDYASGFEDGWHGRTQSVAGPLEQGP